MTISSASGVVEEAENPIATPGPRPEHAPEGYEWLLDVIRRVAAGHDDSTIEKIRSALAEGKIEALLRSRFGERHPIALRMWDKELLFEKVYPRFRDGVIRMALDPAGGRKVEGWIFVRQGDVERCLAKSAADRGRSRFSPAEVARWYRTRVVECNKGGVSPTREEDENAFKEKFGNVSREVVRQLRRKYAPPQWQRRGRRKIGGKMKPANLPN